MASNKLIVCRFCCAAVPRKHTSALFTPDALSKDLPGRLSTLLQLPVASDDGHPPHCCGPCLRKFLSSERFVTTAKCSYQSRSREGNELSPVTSGRKRGKDSSGPDVSPFTSQSQPSSKRSTGGVAGRRLAFTPRETLMIVVRLIISCYSFLVVDNESSLTSRRAPPIGPDSRSADPTNTVSPGKK